MSVAPYSRPGSFFSPSLSPLEKSSPLEKKDSFVDVLKSSHAINPAFSLNKKPTKEQAVQAAKDVMQAFYTQFLKMMFENLKDEDDENPYQNDMMRGLLAENLSKTLGQKMTPTHTKIAEVMLKNGAKSDEQKDQLNAYPPTSAISVAA